MSLVESASGGVSRPAICETEFDRTFFPSVLAPFEHYMLFDDAPERPMTSYARLILSGPLDVELLRESFPEALQRHPLLRANVRYRGRGRWEWVSAIAEPLLDIAPESEPIAFSNGEYIDLEREPGLRLWVRHGDNRARIVMQIHHTCSDGRGKFNFLTEWLAIYARKRGSGIVPEELPQPEYDTLFHRGTIGGRTPESRRLREKRRPIASDVRHVWQVLRGGSLTLSGSTNPPQPSDTPDAFAVETLSAREFAGLKRLAADAGVSLTDWLVGSLFRVVLKWQNADASPADKELVRIIVPFDVRTADERRQPAANRVSMRFVMRKVRQARDEAGLLRAIHEELDGVRRRREQALLLRIIGWLDRFPFLLRRVVQRSGVGGAAVFSNLGNMSKLYSPPLPVRDGKWHAGDLVVEEVHNTTGVRRGTPIAIGAVGYANNFSLISRADSRGFTPEHVRSFLRSFADDVRERVAGRG